MAVGRSIENIEKDLTGNLERDLNIFVRAIITDLSTCLLYTSPSPRDSVVSRMPSSA